jgi:3-methyladenine DNA glycosylase AlkD
MATVNDIMAQLKQNSDPCQLPGMARFGITIENRLGGVSVPYMRKLAKATGKDHQLALELWKTGIAEAKIVASMVDDAKKLTGAQMDNWVKDFDSWDVCDQVCMNLFDKTPLAWQKVIEWSQREEEFVKRAAFTLIACLAWHDKEAKDEQFTKLLPVIESAATDERNFVKKAVNWALRHIGKRNINLNPVAIKTAQNIAKLNSKAALWIAADAIRELESDAVQARLKRL